MSDLTPRQERFCQEYLVDLSGKHAAIRAGYAPGSAEVTASRLLSQVKVAARIEQLQGEARQRSNIEIDDVVSMLMASYKDAKAANQHGPAVRAAELLGKRLGAFTDKVQFDNLSSVDPKLLIARFAGDYALCQKLMLGFAEGRRGDEDIYETVRAYRESKIGSPSGTTGVLRIANH